MRYESEILYDLMKRDGLLNPSQEQLPYESELKEKYVDEVKGAYPKVTDYRPEWLNYNLGYYIPADFPTETLVNVTSGTVNNVVPYAFKSAILKGNTIKNLTLNKDIKFKQSWSGGIGTQSSLSSNSTRCSLEVDVEPNTMYSIYSTSELYIRQATADYTIIVEQDTWTTGFRQLTTTTNVNKLLIGVRKSDTSSYTDIQEAYGNIIVKGDYIIDDYFEDLKSVKMPVLKTTGKNLFDVGTVKKGYTLASTNGLESENAKRYVSDFIYVKGLTDITITNPQRTQTIWGYDENKQPITKVTENPVNGNFVTSLPSNITYIRIAIATINQDDITDEIIQNNLVQVEAGRQISSYEPYKSNILTTNEEVELRGIDDVKDELDLLTGELTERVGEIVFDGSEDWTTHVYMGTRIFKTIVIGIRDDKIELMCNRINNSNAINHDTFHFKATTNGIEIMLDDSSITTIDNFKQYISLSKENPIIIQYQLATESIKTVDLSVVNQDGVETTFRPFDGTMHIQTDGTPLKPLFSGEIPVEATTQNLASFVALEGVERTVNEYVEDEEIVGDENNEQLL